MKKLLAGFIVFIAAFAVGYMFVPELVTGSLKRPLHLERPSPEILELVRVIPETVVQTQTADTDDFNPEFTDLPNFDELYPDEPAEDETRGKLIEVFHEGIYRESEVVAKNGESWLVLVKSRSGYRLERSVAKVEKQKTVSWPGDEPEAVLTFKTSGPPIFAVRNITGLKAGSIPTLFQRGMWDGHKEGSPRNEEMSDGYRREFDLAGNKYMLRTSRGITKDGTKVAVLVLELDGVSQILVQKYHVPSDDRDIIGSLLWVGDLDNDGKLDLYFDDFNEKGSIGTELHLSTKAIPGKLVGLAASFGTAGC